MELISYSYSVNFLFLFVHFKLISLKKQKKNQNAKEILIYGIFFNMPYVKVFSTSVKIRLNICEGFF